MQHGTNGCVFKLTTANRFLKKVLIYFHNGSKRSEMAQKRESIQAFFKQLGFMLIELTLEQAVSVIFMQAGKTGVVD